MLEGLAPKTKDALCTLMVRATELSKEDYAILMEALESPLWTSNGLCDALRERGFSVSRGVISNHRKKVCACVR